MDLPECDLVCDALLCRFRGSFESAVSFKRCICVGRRYKHRANWYRSIVTCVTDICDRSDRFRV